MKHTKSFNQHAEYSWKSHTRSDRRIEKYPSPVRRVPNRTTDAVLIKDAGRKRIDRRICGGVMFLPICGFECACGKSIAKIYFCEHNL